MKTNIHDGHRDRMKQRFLKEGLTHFDRHQIVEMLLFFGIPRIDTNEQAHRLMDTFGSLSGILEAPYEELRKVEGIPANAAALICFCGQLFREYYEDKYAAGTILHSTEDIGRLVLPKFMGRKNEAVLLICLDNRGKVLNSSVVFEGSVNAAEINIRLILQQALRHNATAAVIAHNHPNGHALPSKEDITTTMQLIKALEVAGIRLIDHLVVAEDDYVSMRETPTIAPIFHRG